MYYEYVICYVDDILFISDDPLCTTKGIQAKLKLKGDNIQEPDMCQGKHFSNITNIDGKECWNISSYKYCTEEVTNVEYVQGKTWFKVAAKVCYPSEMWLSSRDGCNRRAQGRWSPMIPRTCCEPEVSSGNFQDRHPT